MELIEILENQPYKVNLDGKDFKSTEPTYTIYFKCNGVKFVRLCKKQTFDLLCLKAKEYLTQGHSKFYIDQDKFNYLKSL